MSRPLDQVEALALARQPILAAARDDADTVIEVHPQHLAQSEGLRLSVDERDVIDAERILERRQTVQVLQHRLRVEAGLDADDEPQAVLAIAEVGDVGDARELLRLHGILDLLDHPLGPHEIRKLGDHDARAARAERFDRRLRPGAEESAAVRVGVLDAVEPDDDPAGREIGTGDELHQLVDRGLRVLEKVDRRTHDLDEVVRGHVRRHADRDAGRAVDQQVRERRGQHVGLLELSVVVGDEVDDVLVEILGERERGGARRASV